MKIEIGEFELYENGSLIIPESKSITFTNDKNLIFNKIIIEFIESALEPTEKFEFAKAEPNKVLRIKLPKKVYGGLANYILVGHLNDRELLFNYQIKKLESDLKLFYYTFVLGKVIEDLKL